MIDSTIGNSEIELQLEMSCKQLKKLQLRSCYAIGDESSLSSFVECLIGLQEVELWTRRAIIDEDLHLTMNKCDDQSGKQDAKEQEMECLVVGDAAVSEPGETKRFGEEKISTSSMFEADASVPEIEKTEKQDAEAQASNDLVLQDALLKPWGQTWMEDSAWMEDSGCSFVCFMDREKRLMKMSNKKINLEFETFSISVFYKRQSSQVKVLFISLLLRAFTSNSVESSDRDDNSGLSISDCMEKCWNNCSSVGFTTSNSNASPEKFSGFQIKHSRWTITVTPHFSSVKIISTARRRWVVSSLQQDDDNPTSTISSSSDDESPSMSTSKIVKKFYEGINNHNLAAMFGDDALGALNIKMVETARSVGVATKFAGSSGAVVAFCPNEPSQVKLLEDAWLVKLKKFLRSVESRRSKEGRKNLKFLWRCNFVERQRNYSGRVESVWKAEKFGEGEGREIYNEKIREDQRNFPEKF
ncbi:unnamed protein product [Camellia sinensis]